MRDNGNCRASPGPPGDARDNLIHATEETGDVRMSPRGEVGPGVLARLRPIVAAALRTGRRTAVGGGWWLDARLADGRLLAALRAEPGQRDSAPHVLMRVARAGDGDASPRADVRMAGLLALRGQPAAVRRAMEAGDLERCIAWAWLADPPAGGAP